MRRTPSIPRACGRASLTGTSRYVSKGVGRPSTTASAAEPLSAREVDFFLAFEGHAPPTSDDVAQALGLGKGAAYRMMVRLRQRGAYRIVSGQPRRVEGCEAVSLLRVDLLDPAALDALDQRMVADPAVIRAAWVTGPMSYRVQSLHPTHAAAHDWFRALLAQRGVLEGRIQFQRVRFDRPSYARALWLGSSTAVRKR